MALDDVQPQQSVAPEDPNAAGATLDPSLTPFLAPPQEPNPQVAPTNGQPSAGQPATPANVVPFQVEPLHYQSLYNQTYAENQALKQQLEFMRSLQNPQAPVQPPPDSATDPARFVEYTIDQKIRAALQEQQRMFQQAEQQRMTQFAESGWQKDHPGIDINMVKNFNRANGIADWNLEAGYRLMTQGQQMQQVAQQAISQTSQGYRQQPQPQAIRSQTQGASPAPVGAISLKFETMLNEYTRNPGIYDSWPPALQMKFDQELVGRKMAQEG